MSPGGQMRFWLIGLVVTVVLLYALRSVLLPFVAGLAVAYLCDPIVDRLERWKLPRTLATSVVIGGALLLSGIAVVLLIPLLQTQITDFIDNVPRYTEAVRRLIESGIGAAGAQLGDEQMSELQAAARQHMGAALQATGEIVAGLLTRSLALINLLSLLFITPIVAFYLLRDWDGMVARIDGLLPRHHAAVIRTQLGNIDRKLAGFVRGQAIVSAILAVFYGTALSIAGLEFGLVIGLSAGAVSFIPYVGSISGFVFSVGLALIQFDSWPPVAVVAGIFVFGQFVEGNFLTPKLVGGKVGLHPVWVIFALLAGGALLGLLGLLLALPVAAVISVLVAFALEQYRDSVLYHGGLPPVEPKEAQEEPEGAEA